jgi:tetratricopeptide (TPR) repeat protein
LEDYRAGEFLAHSLLLLEYPIEQDQRALDIAPFQVKPPPPPPHPAIPILPHVWYPKPSAGILPLASTLVQPQRPLLFIGGAAQEAAERIMKPLLAGQGPMIAQGEAGIGKTSLLQYVATHEKTRQRFRRIWYFEDAERVGQLGAIHLGLSNVLAQTDPFKQVALLANELDDDTLLVIDNLMLEHPLWMACQMLSPYVLLGVETPPENPLVDEDGKPLPLPEDAPNTVTLRRWAADEAVNLLAHSADLLDRKGIPREVKPTLEALAALVDNHPLGLVVLGSLLVEDDLDPAFLLDSLRQLVEANALTPGPEAALRLCIDSLPSDYRKLLEAFAPYPSAGVSASALQHSLKFQNELLFQRGLTLLKRRNLIQPQMGQTGRYSLFKLVYRRMQSEAWHDPGKNQGERARDWVIRFIDQHVYEHETLFLHEDYIRFAYAIVRQYKLLDFAAKLNRALSDYLRTYLPSFLPHDAPPPRLMGERHKALQLARQGLETGAAEGHEQLLQAIDALKIHGSAHDHAQALVLLACLEDQQGDAGRAAQLLEQAAKLVFDLNAPESLSTVRLGLAMAYRHLGRYKDALGVLDERPEAEAERARIYRASGNLTAMVASLSKAGDMTPYAKAESYLQAQQYAEALAAIAEDNSPASHYLRALVYHLQEDYETALKGYQRAVQTYPHQDPQRTIPIRGMASIYTLQENYDAAEELLTKALDDLKAAGESAQVGLTLVLLAAINLLRGNNRTAAEMASQAIQKLQGQSEHFGDLGLAYQILGRACWRLERLHEALKAFLNEVESVQSDPQRQELTIGIAFFHTGEAYRRVGQVDKTVIYLRRALHHINPNEAFLPRLMTEAALQRALQEAGRYAEALEANQSVLDLLDQKPPPDLGYLGYHLCVMVRAYEAVQNLKQAYKPFMRWQNTLAGRADALTDEARPQLAILALNLAARTLMESGRFAEADPLAESALALADEHLLHSSEAASVRWAARRDYGEILLAQSKWHQSLEVVTPLLDEEVKSDLHTYAAVYQVAGVALHQQGEDRTALEQYWVALETQPNPYKQGLLFEKIAHSYLDLGEIPNAVENLHEALKFIDRKAHASDTARILTTLAHTLAGVNRYADAIGVYQEALRMLEALPEVSALHTARVYDSLGRSQERQGQLAEACNSYRKALDIIEKNHLSAPEDYRAILLRMARTLLQRNDYDAAIPYFEKARDDADQWGTRLEVGNISRELAEAERDGGYLARSLKTYEDGLAYLTLDYPADRAALLRSYGQALAQSQQFEQARHAWSEALTITQEMSPLEVALTHHAIGQAYRAQADYQAAEQAYREALLHHPNGTVHSAATYRELGESLFEAARFEETIAPLEAALTIEKALPQQSNARLVKVLQLLGMTAERLAQPQSAIGHYHAALVYMDRAFQPQLYAQTLHTLGKLYAQLQKWEECQKALAECLELELALKPRSEERIAGLFRLMGDSYISEGYLEKAALAFKKMASYVNLTQEDSTKLRSTLNDLERYKATLRTALDSLSVLEKANGEVKDFIFVYALIVRMYYLLSEMEASRTMMTRLVRYLQSHAESLKVEDERADYRSLAYFRLALSYESQQDRPNARDCYRKALKDNSDPAMAWLIEQSMQAVM